ncbi:hypothetical protein PRIPAC_97293, partial [Pristionchus pacificus]|uniref:Cytochrome P450 n=1 Tax=Pristionchus pacificus TaxID=54126 RepID=A0A2A6D2M4_PRIPA
MSSYRLPSLMEPLHQLHSSSYEVDKRQPLMYLQDALPVISQSSRLQKFREACSSDSSEGYDNEKTMIERERTIITENEWAMRVMQSNQMNNIFRLVEGYRIQVDNLNTEIERHREIRWYEGEMKKMGLGMVTSFYLYVHIFMNKCFVSMLMEGMRAREWRLEGRLAFLDLLLHMWNEGSMEGIYEGHDTTATALTWALHLIGNGDNIQRLIHEEVDAVLLETRFQWTIWESSNIWSVASKYYLSTTFITCKFIEESLRLFPSVPIIMRELGEDQELNGHVSLFVMHKLIDRLQLVPKGAHLLLNIYLTHRDHNHWDDPEVFRPERRIRLAHVNISSLRTTHAGHLTGQINVLNLAYDKKEKTILAWIFRHFKIKSSERRFEVRTKMELMLPLMDFSSLRSYNI